MAAQIAHFHSGRTSWQNKPALDRHKSPPAARVPGEFPRRPTCDVLSSSIPLFFIARNRAGLWIAREAEGRIGGIFLFRKSALSFAKTSCGTAGCATMFLADCLELDVENRGPRAIAWISAALDYITRYVPDYPPPIPMLEKRCRKERS